MNKHHVENISIVSESMRQCDRRKPLLKVIWLDKYFLEIHSYIFQGPKMFLAI